MPGEAKHTAAQQYCLYMIQLLHIQFPTVGVPLHSLHHRLLTVRLQLVVLKLGGSSPSPVLEAVGPKLHNAVDGPDPEEEVSSKQE